MPCKYVCSLACLKITGKVRPLRLYVYTYRGISVNTLHGGLVDIVGLYSHLSYIRILNSVLE